MRIYLSICIRIDKMVRRTHKKYWFFRIVHRAHLLKGQQKFLSELSRKEFFSNGQ